YLDGEAPPESLVIQCVPFVHGMLYLGSADPLVKEDIGLMKSLAGAFSVAYARYLDFQKLEAQNRALEEANRKVQEATERKSLFLASMSHELRTPMNAIIGFTRLVLRRAGDLLPERQRENLEKVQQSAGHLLGLINDILDLSKIEAGRMEVQAETFGVKEMVAGCCATVGPLVKEGVVLGYEVAEGVGEAHTDPAKLRQVVINLLSNALKFTEAGEVSVRVTRAEEVLVLAVSDTGAGIPPEMLEAIFEEFRQVEGANREHKGTGLGLSITKKLVELLGGTVSVESEAWKGSIFTVKVPAVYRG
ncbi:MAG: HAMP domain-containing sensor histidine kinase, partial [bacterium]|nr:HAMP domain-containing sensor histidine kinase [bacterium]